MGSDGKRSFACSRAATFWSKSLPSLDFFALSRTGSYVESPQTAVRMGDDQLESGSKYQVRRVRVIDSHTGGEPTRLVISGGPALGDGTLADRVARFRNEHDAFRSAVVDEPRGSDVVVGALLCQPCDPSCRAGVIFFNNVGYLGMCGHGTIGLIASLAHMGMIEPGEHRVETPVGAVTATLHEN